MRGKGGCAQVGEVCGGKGVGKGGVGWERGREGAMRNAHLSLHSSKRVLDAVTQCACGRERGSVEHSIEARH